MRKLLLVALLISGLFGQAERQVFETAHWTSRGPSDANDEISWFVSSKDEDEPSDAVNSIVELYKHDVLKVIVRNRVTDGDCVDYNLVVEKVGSRFRVRQESWVDNDCTRCCKNPVTSKRKKDLKNRVLPSLKELPEEVKKDLRPYLAAAGVKI